MFHCFYLNRLLVVVFTGSLASCAQHLVRGTVGQNITLPCHYNVGAAHGTTSACWGRGECPTSKCSNDIIWTDGTQVTSRKSAMYQLMGEIYQGDISLTIVNVAEKDGGTYCCRVEIPGWFNDEINHVTVVIEQGHLSLTSTGVSATTYSIQSPFTLEPSWESNSKFLPNNMSVIWPTLQKEQRKSEHSSTAIYVGIGTLAVLLVTVTLLLITWNLHKKQKMTNSTSQVAFSNAEIGGIHHALDSRTYTEENIYV